MNLASVIPATNESPFLNAFKTGGGWYTILSAADTAEEAYLYTNCLDSNGYPVTLTTTVGSCNSGGHTFNAVASQIMTGQTFYGGTWVFDYDNTGTFIFAKDGSAYTSCPITGHPNRHLFTSSAAGNGISITLSTTGSGSSYAQNIRTTYAPTSTCGNGVTATQDSREVSLYGGELFDPNFISFAKNFKTLRFMDWMVTNSSTQSIWANRPTPGWVFWDENTLASPGQLSGSPMTGVPAETMAALCAEISADCWFNMPHAATDDYVTQFATAVHTKLANSSVRVYVEYSNEVWNSAFGQWTYVGNQALNDFGAGHNDGAYQWQGMRQSQVGALWKTAWGSDSGRVISTLGVQSSGSPSFGTDSNLILTTPLWTGTGVKLQFTASASGTTLSISSIASGSPQVGSPVFGINISIGTKITACPGGVCGGTGNYTINNNVGSVGSETMAGGGGAAPGGPAYTGIDAIAGAPYWGYGPNPAWITSADGGVSQTFTEAFSGGLMPTASPNCTTGGTSTAYTVSSNTGNCASNGSVTCPPADQTMISVNFNQSSGANPTFDVDGCTTHPPIQNPAGTNTTVGAGTQTLSYMGGSCAFTGSISGNTLVATLPTNCYIWVGGKISGTGVSANTQITGPSTPTFATTSFTVNNSQTVGSTTITETQNSWILTDSGVAGGMLKQMNDAEAAWTAYTAAASWGGSALPFVGYESGQGLSGQNAINFGIISAVLNDTRMFTAYSRYFQDWKANSGQIINHYNDIGPWGTFGFWSILPNGVLQTQSPRYNGMLDFIRRNPCSWSGCRH